MFSKLALPIFILTLSFSLSTAQTPDKFEALPVTPELTRQVSQYALQVTGRSCSARMFARTLNVSGKAVKFSEIYRGVFSGIQASFADKYPDAKVTGNVNKGDSGYIYANLPSRHEGSLLILSRQMIKGQPHIVEYGCQLK